MAKLVLVLAAVVALCAGRNVQKRQIINNNSNVCLGNNGNSFQPDPTDCSRFIECWDQSAFIKPCPPGLEFNPATNYCDWPSANANPSCQRTSIDSTRNSVCNGLGDVSSVAHPSFCNAYMKCNRGRLEDGCTFCPQGMYFDANGRGCVTKRGSVVANICGNRQMIPPRDQTIHQLFGSCHPIKPDMFQPILDNLRNDPKYRHINFQ